MFGEWTRDILADKKNRSQIADEKKPAFGGLILESCVEINATIHLAGAFLAGFLVFFGLAVALFISISLIKFKFAKR